MSTVRFCVSCGGPLTSRWIMAEGRTRDLCERCGRVHYDNPKVLVAVIVQWQDRIVLCRRAIEPAMGYWNVPMGFVETGESLEEAGVRELREETGLQIPEQALALCTVCSLPDLDQIHVVFRAELTAEPALIVGAESSEIGLFSEADLPFEDIAFADALTDRFRDFFRQQRDRDFRVTTMTIRRPGRLPP